MLPGPRFSNKPLLSHALGKQALPQGIVDLVSAGVQEILSLEPKLRATTAEALSAVDWRGPPSICLQKRLQLLPESWILNGLAERLLKLDQCGV
jgi:hypothetical protein